MSNPEISSIIKVIGVGGGGSNAVNYMFRQGIKDVSFVVVNTDLQALADSPIPTKMQIGGNLTEGRGAGSIPAQGKKSAEETISEISEFLKKDTKMAFITAGMGGGTGTGAAPVIAQTAKELGILTVGIVTIPFAFEGKRRIDQAIEGIKEINNYVDSLLVINNEKLREMYGNLKMSEAFSKADNVLTIAAKGIAEIITVPGYINVDFADVRTVMSDSGVAIMGSASAGGDDRAMAAITEALNSPLLNNNDIRGSKNILLNLTSGKAEITMDEISRITDYIQKQAGNQANVIWGNGTDDSLGDKINVTIIATGFEADIIPEIYAKKEIKKTYIDLESDKVETREITEEPIAFRQTQSSTQLSPDLQDIDTEILPSQYDQPKLKRTSLKRTLKAEEIDELEQVPAYKRKNIQIEQSSNLNSDKISDYQITDDDNGNEIKPNPYYNNTVD